MRSVRMSGFAKDLKGLCDALDPVRHRHAKAILERVRNRPELVELAQTQDGWLGGPVGSVRVKLVLHGTGTFLVVQYEDGWSTTLAKAMVRS